MTNCRRKSKKGLKWRFINSGHMIANKDKVGHNCNACNMLFRKIQYLKYHMEDNCLLQQPAKKQSLESTRHKLCIHFYSKEDKYLCKKYLHILSWCTPKRSAWEKKLVLLRVSINLHLSYMFNHHINIRHKTIKVLFIATYLNFIVYKYS